MGDDFKIKQIPITRNEVFEKLFEAIIFGYIKPGTQLIERELSQALGVSRTPIREVLRELERLDLVTSHPYKGVIVNRISLKKAKELCLVRMHLEKLAIELCIKNINKKEINILKSSLKHFKMALKQNNIKEMLLHDDTFHTVIYESTKNDVLIGILKNLRAMIGQCRLITLPNLEDKTYEDHMNIFKAIINQDVISAQKYIQNHIENFYNILKQEL